MTFQMFPEISLVKEAPHLRGLAGSLYQAGAAQSEEDRFVVAGVAPHYFAQPCDQVAFIVNPEQVVTQMVAEGTAVVGGLGEDVCDAGAACGDQVESAPRQVRMAVEQVHQKPLFVVRKRRAVALVEVGDLLAREIFEVDDLADVKRRL